jgi:hypothetical protein
MMKRHVGRASQVEDGRANPSGTRMRRATRDIQPWDSAFIREPWLEIISSQTRAESKIDPQGEARILCDLCGTAEAVPFPNPLPVRCVQR